METKFGKARFNRFTGYYDVTPTKKHKGGRLHRLIWEDFYGCEIPKGYVIHHKNGIKSDNCILNLQLMRDSDHRLLHSIGTEKSLDSKLKQSMKTCIMII